jgi:hypothetical protein
MIYCQELKKSFDTVELMFAELRVNKEMLVESKKAMILKSCDKGAGVVSNSLTLTKALEEADKAFKMDDQHYYVAVNSTNIMDSHMDLHKKGLWKRSIKDQQGKNYFVADHELKVLSVIAKREDIEMMTATIPFSAMGKDYEGDTEVLIYKIAKDKVSEAYKGAMGGNLEASVRMQYVKYELAMNSSAKEDVAEKILYDANIDTIANKAEFGQIDYFFVVSEAKNVRESSLVLFGSNPVTGLMANNKEEPAKTISEVDAVILEEPAPTTHKRRRRGLI